MKRITDLLYCYRALLILGAILVFFGLTLFKTLAISNPVRDESYIEGKREKENIAQLKIDKKLEDQINQLLETKVDVQPRDLGSTDPFNP